MNETSIEQTEQTDADGDRASGPEVIIVERIDGTIAKPHSYTAIVSGEPTGIECDARFLHRAGKSNGGGVKFSSAPANTPERIGVKLMIESAEAAGDRVKNSETHALMTDDDALGLAAMLIADVAAARGSYADELADLEAKIAAMRSRAARVS